MQDGPLPNAHGIFIENLFHRGEPLSLMGYLPGGGENGI